MIKTDIIIVTHNSEDYLPALFDSLMSQSEYINKLIIVDNGSKDATPTLINDLHLKSELLQNTENRGFCAAVNQGIKRSDAEYIMLLNSDTYMDKYCLKNLAAKISDNTNPKTGMFAPKLLRYDKITIDSTGLELSYCYRLFDRGAEKKDTGKYDSLTDIFAPCGACAVYSRQLLEEIKQSNEYLDEDFFFLVEDFDLGWRASNRGWKALYVPEAVCYHKRNSSAFDERFRQYLSFRNRAYLLTKNCRFSIRLIIALLFYDIPRTAYMFITNTSYCINALKEILSLRKKMSAKRKTAE